MRAVRMLCRECILKHVEQQGVSVDLATFERKQLSVEELAKLDSDYPRDRALTGDLSADIQNVIANIDAQEQFKKAIQKEERECLFD